MTNLILVKTLARAVSKVFVDSGSIQMYRYGMNDIPFIVIPTKSIKTIEIKTISLRNYLTVFQFHENTETAVSWPCRDSTDTFSWEEEPVDLINKMVREWSDLQKLKN
jgi:hypothetical protein